MPSNNQLPPPPYHDPDVNSQVWRDWFSSISPQIQLASSGSGGTTTTVDQSSTFVTYPAAEFLPAGSCVYITTGGQAAKADPANLTTRHVVGIVAEQYNAGQTATIHTSGRVTLSISVFTPNQPLYVGASGVVTHTVPTTGYTKLMGAASSTNSIILHWQPSVELYEAQVVVDYAELVLSHTPYVYYRLDETSPTNPNGGAMVDSSVNSINGIYRAEAIEQPTIISGGNYSADLSTASGIRYLEGSSSTLLNSAQGTLEFWFTPNWSQTDGITHQLFGYQLVNDVFYFEKFSNDNIYVGWVVNNVDYRAVVTSNVISSGQKHHAVVTWDEGDTTKVYINDTLVATGAVLGAFPTTFSTNVFFGARATSFPYNTPDVGSDMFIDEVAIYHSVLSAEQVSAHYAAGI